MINILYNGIRTDVCRRCVPQRVGSTYRDGSAVRTAAGEQCAPRQMSGTYRDGRD
ncbi:MAG: hypothetical protein LBT83_05490 [Tannerella sp.]|nr:hypothetical protein [Tannerella sp.]